MILHQTVFIFTFWSVRQVNLPTADIDCDLADYVDIICGKLVHCMFLAFSSLMLLLVLVMTVHVPSGILDIPVYKNRIHSLHVLFTLYSEFKNSQVSFICSTIL